MSRAKPAKVERAGVYCLLWLGLFVPWLTACTDSAAPTPAAPLAEVAPPADPSPVDQPRVEESAAGADSATTAEQPQFERIILFTPSGPLVLHLRIEIHGQPQAALAEHVIQKAASCLGATDGTEPEWSALIATPAFAFGLYGNMPIHSLADGKRTINDFDLDHDGRAQHDELAACLARDTAHGQPLAVDSFDDATWTFQQDSPLFVLLDADADGQISAAERSAAFERLRSRDADDDDLIAPAELDPPVQRRDTPTRHSQTFALELNSWEIDSIYYALREKYHTRGGLDASVFALAPSLFDVLDADHDGVVDESECAALVEARADLKIDVSFAASDDRPRDAALQLLGTSEDLRDANIPIRAHAKGMTISLPDGDVELFVSDMTGGETPIAIVTASFKTLDTNDDQILDTQEMTQLASMIGLAVERLDQNADGRLSLDEVRHALAEEFNYRDVQVQVRVGQRDDPLFAWLDSNGDGRLTPRDMIATSDRLAELDRDGDGLVTGADVPARLTCAILRGVQRGAATPRGPESVRPDGEGRAPRWFTAMDRNADDEISRREFLGTAEQFAALDLNADGFIDADEIRQQSPSAAPAPATSTRTDPAP